MLDIAIRQSALAYYERIGASLFPIPAGQKAPFGLVASFKHDHSSDPEQWKKWETENPGCNFGIVAFASNLVICDIDTSGGDAGRAEAWSLWSELCTSWGLPGPLSPSVQSARGGWHCYAKVPAGVDASTLRQPDAIKKRINVRCVGYTVAAGSYYDGTAKGEESGAYLLMSDASPHPAPAALIDHCTRASRRPLANTFTGSRDRGDVAALLNWLNECEAFADYESWFQCGMALKLEYGDSGLELWDLTHDNSVAPGEAATKWESFATEPNSDSVTLDSFLKRAHSLGWRGTIRKSTHAMFNGVAQLAAATGASLSSGMPTGTPAGMPMMSGQAEMARLTFPVLRDFLDATADVHPTAPEWPTLPSAMAGHDLYVPMVATITRIVALSETPTFKPTADIVRVLIVLSELHADVYEAIARRLDLTNPVRRKIKLGGKALADDVQRAFVRQDDWIYDARSGLPEHDNPDNVVVFLEIVGCEIRWNDWLEQMEIRGGNDADLHWSNWTYVDDTIVAELRMRALREKTRFKMGKDFAWDALLSLSRKNKGDPVLDTLARLQGEWDGTPRLSHWLTKTCGAPDDLYHQTVSKIIIGGMVRRIRQPGCKHDFIPVFFGPQGTGKSTIAKIIADMGESTLAQIDTRSTPWFSDEVMLGDESKELVLSLAGKCLVEIGEMGQRSSANTDHAKAMLSRQVDRGRTAYARSVTNRPRRNVFFGTINGSDPLTDTSGNRRYLPVEVKTELNLQWLSDNIAQIIGESAVLESKGVTFAMPKEVYAIAAEHQEAARSVSDLEARLSDWFAETPHTQSAYVTTADLGELAELTGWKGQHSLRNAVLRRLGFRDMQCYVEGKKAWVWYRGQHGMGKHVSAATRYTVGRDAAGRVRVGIRAGVVGAAGGLPPLPY